MNRTLRHAMAIFALAVTGTALANVTFYSRENFGGRDITLDQGLPNFEGRFNDRARSAIVDQGRWEVCDDAGFRGQCEVLGPGRYPDLGRLTGQVSSARPLSNVALADQPRPRGYRGEPRAILFEGRNLTGRSLELDNHNMRNLEGTGLNDRVSSLRVEGGYWLFCSDANFSGECRTFGPGDYPNLPPGLNDRISSGRRISSEYPYRENPNWGQR